MNDGGSVHSQRDGAIVTLTIDAPATRNALTPRMLCQLADALLGFGADDALRCAIVTGAGDAAFCSGGDLRLTLPLLTGDRAPQDAWDRRLLEDPAVLGASGLRGMQPDKPVIAAINGACLAAGFELMLGCDLRIAADHASFALPEVRHGLLPFAGSLVRLQRQVAQAHAMEILLTGSALDAAEAWRIGLVNRVVPQADVLPAARDAAQRIADNAPLAVRAAKRTVLATSGLPLDQAWPIEDAAWAEVRASADAREGPRAFAARRRAKYEGR